MSIPHFLHSVPWEKQSYQVWGLDAHCNNSYLIFDLKREIGIVRLVIGEKRTRTSQ